MACRSAPVIGGLGSCSWRPHVPPPDPAEKSAFGERPRAARARRLWRLRRVAKRGERSLHTHPRPLALSSPRSALACASTARPPAPAGPLRRWAAAHHGATTRDCVEIRTSLRRRRSRRIAPIADGVKASATHPP
jgi:hypothetical protein